MFSNISWSEYSLTLLILLLVYYFIIGLWFYYYDLKNLLVRTPVLGLGDSDLLSDVRNENVLKPQEDNHSEETRIEDFIIKPKCESDVQTLLDRLRGAISVASERKFIKQEFFLYLQLILKEYPGLKDSDFKSAINNLIISECENYNSVTFSEEEIELIWNEVA